MYGAVRMKLFYGRIDRAFRHEDGPLFPPPLLLLNFSDVLKTRVVYQSGRKCAGVLFFLVVTAIVGTSTPLRPVSVLISFFPLFPSSLFLPVQSR